MRLIFLLCAILLSPLTLASDDFSREEKEFSERLQKACDLPIEVNLHDYSYGRDEQSMYSNRHFEEASNLVYQIEEGCKINPQNQKNLERVKTITVKRGSIQERKLIQKKNGDIVYLANRLTSEQSKASSDIIRADLVRVLKLSYTPQPKPEDLQKAKALEATKLSEEILDKEIKLTQEKREKEGKLKQEDQNKKITELSTWFQAEVKKITTTSAPGPEMATKLQALQKTYQEKINALTHP